jgi:transcriptional regulator with XRE-family HTH domain
VKELRREKGLTQDRLAKQAGITVTYIGRIERGERNLTWTALTRLCHGLGVQRSTLAALVDEGFYQRLDQNPEEDRRLIARIREI